jgi:hypothetical protein
MRISRMISFFLFVALVTGCTTMITDVNYDYDREVDFRSLKTYDWMSIQMGSRENELVLKRVKYEVNTQLEAKGLKMTSENPDFLVALQASKKTKIDFRKHLSSSRHVSDIYTWEEGTLVLDFIDGESEELIWRATASGVLATSPSPEERNKNVNKAVKRMLKNFPPAE